MRVAVAYFDDKLHLKVIEAESELEAVKQVLLTTAETADEKEFQNWVNEFASVEEIMQECNLMTYIIE